MANWRIEMRAYQEALCNRRNVYSLTRLSSVIRRHRPPDPVPPRR